MDYLNEQLLIAMPGMGDPNFDQGVTLLCQHTADGALGITINRVSDFTMMDVLAQMGIRCEDSELANRPIFDGGPVHPERGFVLHTPEGDWDSSTKIANNIVITTSRDILQAIADGQGPEKFIVALGYAGWAPGQLEDEIKENAWLNTDADSDILFDLPIEKRWQQAVSKLGIDISNLHAGGHA